MAEDQTQIIEIANKFIELVKGRGIVVDSSYLFGSYANNNFDDWSDIDIAIVSESFEGNILIDIEKILGLSRLVDTRISVLPLNNESLDSYFIQKEVIEKGIKIN